MPREARARNSALTSTWDCLVVVTPVDADRLPF
ncbi:MAG: hypothetical protein QG671_1482 [Actinomycetota bacterium]|nr:hypothetical protein [Actinomycetota bacterium]